MKFKIDLDTNNGFVQFFGATEYGMLGEMPIAFQVRGGLGILESIAKTLEKCVQEIVRIDENYHTDTAARNDYEYGVVVFTPGRIPITAILQERIVTLVVGTRTFGGGPVKTTPLLEAIRATIAEHQ